MKQVKANFIGGEYNPDLRFRQDDTIVSSGLIRCLNMIPQETGVLRKRPGTEYIDMLDSPDVSIYRYSYTNEESAILMFGEKVMHIYTSGGALQQNNSTDLVSVNVPWTAEQAKELSIAQSGTKITVCHKDVPPHEIVPMGSHGFEVRGADFGGAIGTPQITDTKKVNTQPDLAERKYTYVVTAVKTGGVEGAQSIEVNFSNQLLNSGSYNKIVWTSVKGAVAYNIYRKMGGTFALVGSVTSTEFEDYNYTADTSKMPSITDYSMFVGAGNYPSFVTYVQGRRVFASTKNEPYTLWMSRSGDDSDFSYTKILADDERIKMQILSNNISSVRHIISTNKIIAMTSDAEWSIQGEPITPKSISAQVQSNVGASKARPCVINSSIIFASNAGSRIFEMGYNWQAGGFISGDISVRVGHLFKGKTVKRIEYTKYPERVIWVLFTDSTMCGCKYIPEQQILAWFSLSFAGKVRDICELTENSVSSLFMVIEREGASTIEKLDLSSTISADCYFEYAGQEVNAVEVLAPHDAQECIVAWGDEHETHKNASGRITVNGSFDKAVIGINIPAGITCSPLQQNQEDAGIIETRNLQYADLFYDGVGAVSVAVPYQTKSKFVKQSDASGLSREEFHMMAKWDGVFDIDVDVVSAYDFKIKAIEFRFTENRGFY